MPDQSERRIIVEICDHAAVERLRQEMKEQDERHRQELEAVLRRVEGVHKTLYEVIDTIGHLRSKR